MEQELIVRVLKLLQLLQDDLNLLLVKARLFKQEKVVDVGIMRKLVRY